MRRKTHHPHSYGYALPQRHERPSHVPLSLTLENAKFKIMNVADMIPASESAAALMRSLSHPQRLLVLCALAGTEKSVSELRHLLGIEQVPMSQQLMRLRADGLVEARRDGTTVYYRVAKPEVVTIIEALHAAFCPKPTC